MQIWFCDDCVDLTLVVHSAQLKRLGKRDLERLKRASFC